MDLATFWVILLTFAPGGGPVYREGILPLETPPEQVVTIDWGNDGDPDLLWVSPLPGETRLLENEGAGNFVDITETTDLPQSPGFLTLTALPFASASPWLVGTDILSPQRLRLYRFSSRALEEVATLTLPSGLTGPLRVLDPQTLLLPLETGVLPVSVDTLGTLEAGPLVSTDGPVLDLWVLPADSGSGAVWLLQTPQAWFLGTPEEPQAYALTSADTRVCPLPFTPSPEPQLLVWDSSGTLSLLSLQGQILLRGTAPPGAYQFLPVWANGLWGWGTTAEGQPALVHFQPALLQWEILHLDSLGETVVPVDDPEDPWPRFLVLGHDSAVLVRLQPGDDLAGWLLPSSPPPRLWVRSLYHPLWFHPWIPSPLGMVVVARADSALWLTPSGPVPLNPPAPGTVVPLGITSGPSGATPVGLWVHPNPTHRTLKIEFLVTEPALVEVLLCRTDGQVLRVLDRSVRQPGRYQIVTQLDPLPPGQYLVVCRRGNEVENRKVILLP